MPSLQVLVIEDEPAALQVLAAAVSRSGYPVDTAGDVAEATAKLARGDVDVALCDIRLPDGNGIDLVKQTRAAGLETAFIMVTAFASVETAVEALRAGAYDYVVKPVRHLDILHRLSQIRAISGLREENRDLRKAIRDSKPLYRFESPAIRKVERMIDKIAPTNSTVLVTGESGTGKGIIARNIHDRSGRSEARFIPVNCGAIPEQLLESEFFGHTKGAFTSADRARKGLFAEADGGTLFLDEISELPLHMQAKLLHVIEDKQVRALGSGQARRVDTRIVAACNRDLYELVSRGAFREDLYFRLSVLQIRVPPLRERAEDIRGLIRFVLAANQRSRGAPPMEIDPDAEQALITYAWPGNVREVENAITRACLLAEGGSVSVEDLPAEIAAAAQRTPASSCTGSGDSLHDQRLRFEAEVIRRAVEEAGGDRRLAAQRLQISLSSLYGKLSELSGKRESAADAESASGNRRQVKS